MHLNSSTSLFRPETNNLLKCNPYDLRVFTHLLTTVRSCVEAIGEVEVKGRKERRRISTTPLLLYLYPAVSERCDWSVSTINNEPSPIFVLLDDILLVNRTQYKQRVTTTPNHLPGTLCAVLRPATTVARMEDYQLLSGLYLGEPVTRNPPPISKAVPITPTMNLDFTGFENLGLLNLHDVSSPLLSLPNVGRSSGEPKF